MPTPSQLRKIWASAREIGLDEAALRALVEGVTGGPSISGLSFAQAREVIDKLVELGASAGHVRTRPKPSGRRAAPSEIKLISGRVRSYIEDLREQLGGKWTEDRYFEGACRRLIKRAHPRTAAEGARVVEMLKARLRHDQAKAESL